MSASVTGTSSSSTSSTSSKPLPAGAGGGHDGEDSGSSEKARRVRSRDEQGRQTDRKVRNNKSKKINHQYDTREAVEDLTRSDGDREPLNNLFWDDPPASGPWHAVVRIERILENGDRQSSGSGFVSDLLAESGSGRKLTVILTAAHVLCKGEGDSRTRNLVNGIAVCNAAGQVLVESHHSQRDTHCTYAVCEHYTPMKRSGTFWDYGAIFLDFHPCFFPHPLIVPRDKYMKYFETNIVRKTPMQVAGYPDKWPVTGVKGNKKLVVSGVKLKDGDDRDCGAGTSFTPSNEDGPCLLFYSCDTDRGESGSPVYIVHKEGVDTRHKHPQWQAVGIHFLSKAIATKEFKSEVASLDDGVPCFRSRSSDMATSLDSGYMSMAIALTQSVIEDILSWPSERKELQVC